MPDFDYDAALAAPELPGFPNTILRCRVSTGSLPSSIVFWTSVAANPNGEIFAYASIGLFKKSATVYTVAYYDQAAKEWEHA